MAAISHHQPGDHVENRGLAGAIRAEQTHSLAGAHCEPRFVHNGAGAVALAQATHAQDTGTTLFGCRSLVRVNEGQAGAPAEHAAEERRAARRILRLRPESDRVAQLTCARGLTSGCAQPFGLPSFASALSPGTKRAETRPPATGSMFARPVPIS